MLYADRYITSTIVGKMIDAYSAKARHHDLPRFEISELLSMGEAIQRTQHCAGVYLIYRYDRTLIYIGMSPTDISARIKKHFSAGVQASEFWQTRSPAWVQVVSVTYPWEAPSLEAYLESEAKTIPL